MLVTTRETIAWWPLVAAAALVLATMLTRPNVWLALAGIVFEPRIYERIQELRTEHGIKVDTAIAFVAEQECVDEEELTEAHFAWCIDRYSQGGSTTPRESSVENT